MIKCLFMIERRKLNRLVHKSIRQYPRLKSRIWPKYNLIILRSPSGTLQTQQEDIQLPYPFGLCYSREKSSPHTKTLNIHLLKWLIRC